MGYSEGMTDMTSTNVPDITPGYPSKGRVIGPAWAAMWRALASSAEPLDGAELARTTAESMAVPQPSPNTLTTLLQRGVKAGLLTVESRSIPGVRGNRNRAFYAVSELGHKAMDGRAELITTGAVQVTKGTWQERA